MNEILAFVLTAAAAYLLGSLCFGIITTRYFENKDIRELGSNNAGMTNVLRAVGVKCGVLTGIGDFLKGAAAILIGRALFTAAGLDPSGGTMLAALFVLVGHILPLYFGFRGGKGVMTTAGIMAIVDWRVLIILLAIFGTVFAVSKIISLASITVAFLLPVAMLLVRSLAGEEVLMHTLFALAIGALIIFNHRTNIKRLLNGTEGRLSVKKK